MAHMDHMNHSAMATDHVHPSISTTTVHDHSGGDGGHAGHSMVSQVTAGVTAGVTDGVTCILLVA